MGTINIASLIKLSPNVITSKKPHLVLLLWLNAPATHLCHGSCLSICTCQFTYTSGFSHMETKLVYFCMPRIQEELIIGLTLFPSFHNNLVIYLGDSQGKEKALFPKTKHSNPLWGFPNQPQTWCFCCISCKVVWPSPRLIVQSLFPKSFHKTAKWNMF